MDLANDTYITIGDRVVRPVGVIELTLIWVYQTFEYRCRHLFRVLPDSKGEAHLGTNFFLQEGRLCYVLSLTHVPNDPFSLAVAATRIVTPVFP